MSTTNNASTTVDSAVSMDVQTTTTKGNSDSALKPQQEPKPSTGFQAFSGFKGMAEGFQTLQTMGTKLQAKVEAFRPQVFSFLDSCKLQGIKTDKGNLASILSRYSTKASGVILEASSLEGLQEVKLSALAANRLQAFLDTEGNDTARKTAASYVSEWRKLEASKLQAETKAQELEIPAEVTALYEALKAEIAKSQTKLGKLGYKLSYSLQGVKQINK